MKRTVLIGLIVCLSGKLLVGQYAEIKLTALYGIPVQDYLQAEIRYKNNMGKDYRASNAVGEMFFTGLGRGNVPRDMKTNLKVGNTWGARFETRTGLSGMGVEVLTKTIIVEANYTDPRTQNKVFERQHKKEGSIIPYYSLHPFQNRFSPHVFDVFFNCGVGYRWGKVRMKKTSIHTAEEYKQRVFPIAITARMGMTYYPIKPLGITFDAGLGLNTINVGLVFRAADL